MKKFVLTAAALAALSLPAAAADMPVKAFAPAPVADWAGVYFGGHFGYGTAHANGSIVDILQVFAFNPTSLFSDPKDGIMGGVHLGYNWQFAPAWVVGVELDISGTDIHGGGRRAPLTNTTPALIPASAAFATQEVDWLASARARLGYIFAPSWMVYATGGVAWADIDYTGGWVCGPASCGGNFAAIGSTHNSVFGWVVGAGTEFKAVGSPWVLGIEYLYYNFDSATTLTGALTPAFGPCALGVPCTTVNFSDLEMHVVRARLSYKF